MDADIDLIVCWYLRSPSFVYELVPELSPRLIHSVMLASGMHGGGSAGECSHQTAPSHCASPVCEIYPPLGLPIWHAVITCHPCVCRLIDKAVVALACIISCCIEALSEQIWCLEISPCASVRLVMRNIIARRCVTDVIECLWC